MRALLVALLTSSFPAALLAQAVQPAAGASAAPAKQEFVRATAEEAVRELASRMEDNFVFPDKGEAYARMLRANLAAGKYSSFPDAQAFADAVTADLQAVHADRHVRVHVVPADVRSGADEAPRGLPPTLNAISKSGWLADGVAYVRFEGFPGTEATMKALRSFIDTHKDAKSLIIDARSHRGGGLAEMDLLFPYLYAQPTVLVGMDTRLSVAERDTDPQEASLRKVTGPAGVSRQEHHVVPAAEATGLRDSKVYLLTSSRTASAGEHLSLSLKRTKRATLIGETTRGAGHYGGMQPLDKARTYAAFIPVGRTFDPDTGEGWEAVGVKPDVAVPADQALDEALKLAGAKVSAEVALAQIK